MKAQQLLTVYFQSQQLILIDWLNTPYVAMRPIVEGMGLTWSPQRAKLQDQKDRFTVTKIVTVGRDEKQREMTCIPLTKLFGWLMTISSNKVKPELKDKVITYQNHCDEVLSMYWLGRNTEKLSHLYQENMQLKEGLYAAHENWEIILEGKRQGLTHKQICEQTGYKATSTIYRNLKKMLGYGLLPEKYEPSYEGLENCA